MTSLQRVRRTRQIDIVRSTFVLNADNIGQRVISGASFSFLGIVLRTFITISSMAILARLLAPSDFGYVAMATVITEFAGLLGNFGFTNVLIQRKVINRLQIDTVFWASMTIGFVLSAIVFLISFFSEWLLAEPKTGVLLRVLCLNFLIGALGNIPYVIISRKMQFRTLFWIELGAVATRSTIAIIFAYLEFGVWSLVAGALGGTVMRVLLSLIHAPYVPRFKFNLNYLLLTWKIATNYLGAGLLFFTSMNIDILLIGRYLGASSVGIYQNGRSLTDEVRARIAVPLQHVLFPAFSSIQTEKERLQRVFVRSASVLAAIVFPIGFGISAVAEELVPVLYGDQWHSMIPVLSMLGLSTALKASTAIATPIFNAQNRVGLNLKYNAIGTALMIMGIIIALPYGIDATAASIVVTSFYSLIILRAAVGLIGLNNKHIIKILGPPCIASLTMWISIYLMRSLLSNLSMHLGVVLFFNIILGMVIYFFVLNTLSHKYLDELKELISNMSSKNRSKKA